MEKNDRRALLSGLALLGLCLGSSGLPDETNTEFAQESRRKIAETAVGLADEIIEILGKEEAEAL